LVKPGEGQDRAFAAEPAGMDMRSLLRRPSAFVPPVLSLAAFLVVAGYVAIYGATREADEGAAAHVWQLLMAAQIPVVGFFLVKWLPRAPRPAMSIFVLQLAAALVALAPVYFLHL
jgi:hypothetical protein